jgi:hypothetical protein
MQESDGSWVQNIECKSVNDIFHCVQKQPRIEKRVCLNAAFFLPNPQRK